MLAMFLCSFFSTERYRTVFSIEETDSYQMRFGIAFVFSLTLPPFFPSIKMKGKVWNFWCKCDNIFRMCIKRYQFSDDCWKKRRKSLSVSFSIVRRHFFASYGKQWKAMYSKGKRMDLKTIQANASSSSPLLLFDACFQINRSIENVYDRWYGKNAEQTPMASIKLFRKSHRLVQQQQ